MRRRSRLVLAGTALAVGAARVEPGWVARDEFSWDMARRRAAVKLSAEWDLERRTVELQ